MAKNIAYQVVKRGHKLHNKELVFGAVYTLSDLGVREDNEQFKAHLRRGNLRLTTLKTETTTGTLSKKEPPKTETKSKGDS